jgi:hypothetical protein
MSALHQARCFNHAQREAVARCPGCRRFYCRECVTEHDDRLMCAQCLAAAAPPTAAPKRNWWLATALTRGVIGQTLLEAPSHFHEGTVWQENWWDSP